MTARALILALAATLAPLAARAQAPAAAPPSAACTAEGQVSYICGMNTVEDLAVVPGDRWIVTGSMKAGTGGLYVIDAKARTAKAAAIAFGPAEAPYAGCAAPDPRALITHGIELRPGPGGVHTVFAVNHGGRESIEVFRVDARGAEPRVAWIGCLMMPANASGNAVASLPDGGLAVTKFVDADDKDSIVHVLGGQITGTVYLWEPMTGFRELPGARLSGDNGLLVSKDGKWLYVNDFGHKAVVKMALDGSGPAGSVATPFRPDNLRWAPDGKIIATGQFVDLSNRNDLHGWAAVKIDPETLAATPYVKVPGTQAFDNGTTTLVVGKTLWIGTYRGDRVAYLPAP